MYKHTLYYFLGNKKVPWNLYFMKLSIDWKPREVPRSSDTFSLFNKPPSQLPLLLIKCCLIRFWSNLTPPHLTTAIENAQKSKCWGPKKTAQKTFSKNGRRAALNNFWEGVNVPLGCIWEICRRQYQISWYRHFCPFPKRGSGNFIRIPATISWADIIQLLEYPILPSQKIPSVRHKKAGLQYLGNREAYHSDYLILRSRKASWAWVDGQRHHFL